jgi:hypothetical protein
VAWLAQVQSSRPAAQRTRPSGANIQAAPKGKGQLPQRHLVSLADRRLPGELQVKRGAENKKSRGPTHNLVEDPLVANNGGRGNQRAERKRAKRLPQVLVLNSSNLGWNKRRPRK